jgi:hypothetical protein
VRGPFSFSYTPRAAARAMLPDDGSGTVSAMRSSGLASSCRLRPVFSMSFGPSTNRNSIARLS